MMYLKNMKSLILIIAVLLAALSLMGRKDTPGIPDDIIQKARALPDQILAEKKHLEICQSDYRKMIQSQDFSQTLAAVAQKENLEEKFHKAGQQLGRADQIHKNTIVPLVKKDRAENAAQAAESIQKAEELIGKATANMKYPAARLARIQDIMNHMESFHETSMTQAAGFSGMVKEMETQVIPKIKEDFPNLTSKIDDRFGPLLDLEKQVSRAGSLADSMFSRYQEGEDIDFAKLTDQVDLISRQYNELEQTRNQYQKLLLSVYVGYSKILDDMKVESVSRRSSPLYFHKYLMEVDGKINKSQDWVPVSEAFYKANEDNLGMAIVSKKAGQFDDEANTHATPPGMAYMGDPKYGEWRRDSNGNSFWAWYGKYALFSTLFSFPPRSFGYNRWNSFHRSYRYDRPYYGNTSDGRRQYGTKGAFTKASSRYRASSFAQTGGFASQSPSVRTYGAKVRGGGPGAREK